MKLGTSTNMFYRHRFENTKPSYAEKIELVADAGFDVADIHFCDAIRTKWNDELAREDWERYIDAAGEAAARRGVAITQSHAPYYPFFFVRGKRPDAEFIEFFAEMSRRAAIASGKLGVKWMTVHPLNDTVNCEYETDIELATNVKFYEEIFNECKRSGVGLAFENMKNSYPEHFTRCYCENPEDLIALVDSYNDASVGICWDFGHAAFTVLDQPRALRKIGKRLKATHVQDGNGSCDSHLIPFIDGKIKWEDIMPCLKEIGYEGDFVFESQKLTKDFPDDLKLKVAKFAAETGRYLMRIYDEA